MQKTVESQGLISTAYSKGGASWKKTYAVWMLGLIWYYSFSDFKLQPDPLSRLILSTVALCTWKIHLFGNKQT